MYESHFGLSEKPFALTPDTQFFYNKLGYRHALNTLLSAVQNNEGFVKITGEVGTGKTLLCRKLLSLLDASYQVIYIANSYLTPNELKGFVAAEIGADFSADMPAYQLMASIYRRLLSLTKQSRQVVLIVDEAQAMPRDTLEALRLLSNLETDKRKLIQVVLIGQPELDQLLARGDLRQLKQRIVFSADLHPLSAHGVTEYVAFRLVSAGGSEGLFRPAALRLLYAASGGVPRLVNVLAHKAMIAAFSDGDRVVGYGPMAAAVDDSPESRWQGRAMALGAYWLWPVAGLAAGLLTSAWLGAV